MPKKTGEKDRFNVTLPPKLSEKLNNYILGVANKQGKMPHAIKGKIMRMALKDWLDEHGKDYDINFDFDYKDLDHKA